MKYTCRTIFFLACPLLLIRGCLIFNLGDTSGPTEGSTVITTAIFSSASFSVYSVRPVWLPDGRTIVFSGSPEGGQTNTALWKVAAQTGSSPVMLGAGSAYCPCALSDGRVVYYTGWIGTDLDMHLMVTDPAGSGDTLSSTIFRTFNGSDVGMGQDVARSPVEMSVSDNGTRAFIIWSNDSSYTLQWNSAGDLIFVNKAQSVISSGAISPDGTQLAYTRDDGKVVLVPPEGGVEQVIGIGQSPTWDAASAKVGFVNGNKYEVYDVATEDSKWYTLKTTVQVPALSPQTDRIVFRTFGSGGTNGLTLGTFSD
jgi:Tol biopolymer transport system component